MGTGPVSEMLCSLQILDNGKSKNNPESSCMYLERRCYIYCCQFQTLIKNVSLISSLIHVNGICELYLYIDFFVNIRTKMRGVNYMMEYVYYYIYS
jgi:hypothetical protein